MNETFRRAALDAAIAELRRQYDEGKPGPYIQQIIEPDYMLIDGRVNLVAVVRAVWNNAIEECAVEARAWLSIPPNENAQNLPDELRSLKFQPE